MKHDHKEEASFTGGEETSLEETEAKPPATDLPPFLDVCRQLRKYREPITLFGETEEMRFDRLKKVILLASEGAEHQGQLNELHVLAKRSKKEQDGALMTSIGGGDDIKVHVKSSKGGKETEMEKKEEKEEKKEKSRSDASMVRHWIKNVVREWEIYANEHGESMMEVKQTREHLKPLVSELNREGAISAELLRPLAQISQLAQEGEYMQAFDWYLQMAIGNAAWPMGVTMVGIHDRAAREKISSQNTAHALNDEVTRKYVQAIKRLLTFCQKIRPTDPSKMMG